MHIERKRMIHMKKATQHNGRHILKANVRL